MICQPFQHINTNRAGRLRGDSRTWSVSRTGSTAPGSPAGMVTRPGGGASGNSCRSCAQRPCSTRLQPRRRGFQQERHEDGELAKADAMFAQRPTGVLIQRSLTSPATFVTRDDAQSSSTMRKANPRASPAQGLHLSACPKAAQTERPPCGR